LITADTIVNAEKMLRIIASEPGNVEGQMRAYQIDRQAYENFHQEMISLFIRRMREEQLQYPRMIIPVLNTLMVHHFLIGVACGRMTRPEQEQVVTH
jgi:hypothetical protein